jgi:FkbM family methyltransferase
MSLERFARAYLGETVWTYVDVGARGALGQPWASLPRDRLRVVGFEPDPEECAALNEGARPGDVYFPYAAWDCDATISLNVASEPSCSSVHPPNAEVLSAFTPRHRDVRVTQRVIDVPATSLDVLFAREKVRADFVKVDTQGSEGEIVRGARNTLSSGAVGVLIESWCVEVHRGQALTGDVLAALRGLGYAPVRIDVAAAWECEGDEAFEYERQTVGLDILATRIPADVNEARRVAFVLTLFGHPGAAITALSAFGACEREIEVIHELAPRRSRLRRAASDALGVAGRLGVSLPSSSVRRSRGLH